LFGPGVLIRGFIAGVLNRHGVGSLAGDGFQMPGVFLISAGRVVREYRHRNAASRPDYAALACPIASDRSASNAAREVQAARAGVV
jgi:hypothetical protein